MTAHKHLNIFNRGKLIMTNQSNELVIAVTHGTDHELSSVALTLANGAITEGMQVTIFLTSAGVDLVRKRSIELTQVMPLESLKSLVDSFIARGGKIIACPPCVANHGYVQENLIDGVEIAGASAIFKQFKNGAASLSF
jgi:predicted peroxiredoxin